MKHHFHGVAVLRRPSLSLIATAACALSLPAQAQAPSTATPAGTTFEIGRVEVTGRATGPVSASQVLSSVDVVWGDTLSDTTIGHAWEIFSRVPGIQLTNFNQGTTSGKISMRGFNGEGEVNAVKLLLDGIPSNSNDGNMPYLDLVTPLDVATITTVRGTNDARYGLYNIAGNVDVASRIGGQGQDLRLATGGHGLADLQWTTAMESGDWSQNTALALRHDDGARDHASADQLTLAGKWFWQADPDWRLGLILRHHSQRAQEPGYLDDQDAVDHPDMSYAISATDGGNRQVSQASLHLDGQWAPDLSWSLKSWVNHYDDSRWVRYSATTSQQERDSQELHTGLRSQWSWRLLPARLTLEAGVDLEHQRNDSQRYLTVERSRSSQTRDQHWTLDTTGGFLQALWQPTPAWRIVPAWRIDSVGGHFENRLTGTEADINHYGLIHQPKLSTVWTLVPGHSLYANWGRTFQIGVGAASYKIPPRQADLAPSRNTGWELGWKFQPLEALQGRLAVWQQLATDEVNRRLNDPSGDSENVGATRRRGLDLQLQASLTPQWQAWTGLSLQRARITTPAPDAPDTAGKELDHVSHVLYNGGLDWQARPNLRLSLSYQGQTRYYLERSNSTGRWGGATTVNLALDWQMQPDVDWTLALNNLSDERAGYVWWDGSQRLHSPVEGFNVQGSLRVRF
ncbi:TonB-dependent receptor [Ideonella sp. B508-1]|uniref:TonB-dependent receptor n=1 Tax=Ideonella sp. B508-1 TaxID=137716 RepID=UPI00034B0C9F|nr:TonB-dependent receptor [Ideonella sp. B508-1]